MQIAVNAHLIFKHKLSSDFCAKATLLNVTKSCFVSSRVFIKTL